MTGILRLGSIRVCPVKITGEANIHSLIIIPSTSVQNITPTGNIDGYSPITVNAVTSSIDNNIIASNIKSGVSILGVTGTYSGGGSGEVRPYCIPRALNGDGKLERTSWTNADFSGAQSIEDDYLLYRINWEDPNIQSVDLGDLISISGISSLSGAFYKCSNIISVDLSSLTTVSAESAMSIAFAYTGLTGVLDLHSLTTVSGHSGLNNAFSQTNITGVNLSSLTTLSNTYAMVEIFNGCTSLTTVSFPQLSILTGSNCLKWAFKGCTSLTTLYFPALTTSSFRGTYEVSNQFEAMLGNVTGCTVHFPSNLQTKLSTWTDVQNGFGGTNTTVLFDLPATS